MRISEIYIKNYLQFKDFRLNLTYPDTGQPLDKICFIGSNGTGKTTLLNLVWILILQLKSIVNNPNYNLNLNDFDKNSLIYFGIKEKSEDIYIFITIRRLLYFKKDILNDDIWKKLIHNNVNIESLDNSEWKKFIAKSDYSLPEQLQFKKNSQDIICYARLDANFGYNPKLPSSSLNNALTLFYEFLPFHDISCQNASRFWEVLIYQIKKREKKYAEFLNSPDIENLTVKEAKEIFEKENPEILQKLAEQWNLILEIPGLEFDIENAKIPIQLNDNLEAYIKLRNTNQAIPYNKLSTGIRNFIFQLGYIYTLYFNRYIQRGFLLIDEPEIGLFPDLLYDIIDRYLSIIQNTQFFVATHNIIIAAQFEPAERFILEFNEDGYVEARSGVSLEGDDPNDLLVNDFVVRSLYGKKGIEQWKRYLELQRLIPETKDQEQKKELLQEYSKIGNAYNFLPHEISE